MHAHKLTFITNPWNIRSKELEHVRCSSITIDLCEAYLKIHYNSFTRWTVPLTKKCQAIDHKVSHLKARNWLRNSHYWISQIFQSVQQPLKLMNRSKQASLNPFWSIFMYIKLPPLHSYRFLYTWLPHFGCNSIELNYWLIKNSMLGERNTLLHSSVRWCWTELLVPEDKSISACLTLSFTAFGDNHL